MFCSNCGAKANDGAAFCSKCGKALTAKANARSAPADQTVKISCPVYPGQLFNNACIAYNENTGTELARCKQGETLVFRLDKPTPVKVIVKGSFGKPVEVMTPGDKYKIGYRGFGTIYLEKVDMLL